MIFTRIQEFRQYGFNAISDFTVLCVTVGWITILMSNLFSTCPNILGYKQSTKITWSYNAFYRYLSVKLVIFTRIQDFGQYGFNAISDFTVLCVTCGWITILKSNLFSTCPNILGYKQSTKNTWSYNAFQR